MSTEWNKNWICHGNGRSLVVGKDHVGTLKGNCHCGRHKNFLIILWFLYTCMQISDKVGVVHLLVICSGELVMDY
jgi:hypothetical protein